MHMHILTHIDILESGIKYKYCKSYSFRIISHHFMQFHVSYVMHTLYTHMNNYIYICTSNPSPQYSLYYISIETLD